MICGVLLKVIGAGAIVASCGTASIASAQNALILNVDSAKTLITRALFGALLEQLGRDIDGGIWCGPYSTIPNTKGMRNDVIQAFNELNLGPFEWPGGCAAGRYHWRNDINKTDVFGTDQYMEWCRLCGIEPYFCVNMAPGGTTTEMADWIRYVNANSSHPEWYCKYWSLGNEPWKCDGQINASQFANLYDTFNGALPSIAGKPVYRIGACAYSTDNMPWLDTMMRRFKGKMEAVNLHYYSTNFDFNNLPSINFTDLQYLQVMTWAAKVAPVIRTWDSVMLKYDPERSVSIMFNEWGAWYGPISGGGDCYQQSTIRDAQVAAIHLNAFINNGERVTAACVAQAVNVIQALLLTNPSNPVQMVKTPTYYTYKLFQAHQNGKKIPAALTTAVYDKDTAGSRISFPLLSAAATVDSAGTVNITISNSHLTADQKLTITLKSVKAYGRVAGQFIWAPAATAYNDFGKTEQVNIQTFADSNISLSGSALTVTVPSKAVVLLQVNPVATEAVTPGHVFVRVKRTLNQAAGRNGSITFRGVAGLMPGTLQVFNPGGRLVAETAFGGGSDIAMVLLAKGAMYWYTLKDRSGNAQISGKLLLVN